MVSPFETVILRLGDLGFFKFLLPFLLTAAIFYGLLRKSKVFGEPHQNIAVNAIVALVAGFMVWAYPILAGVDVTTQFSKFIFQSTVAMFTIIIGLLIAGMFFPEDLPKKIGDVVKTGRGVAIVVVAGIIVMTGILFSSGLSTLIVPSGIFNGVGGLGFGGIDQTTLLSAIVILVMGAAVMGIVWGGPGGKK